MSTINLAKNSAPSSGGKERSRPPKSEKIKDGIPSQMFDVCNVITMIFILIVVLYPIINIIAISFSSADHIAKANIGLIPKGFTVQAYKYVLQDIYVWKGYANSIFYSLASTFIMLLFTSMIAYALTVQDFMGKKFITIFLTITMFFGGGMIPTYLLFMNLHMLDTVWVMILPGCVGAYNVFVFRTFFQSQPGEMRESALIDGANDLVILFRIILPLSKALLATFALFGIVGCWNSWFNALLYLKDQDKYPVQLVLRNYLFVIDSATIQQRAGMGASLGNSLIADRIDPKGVRMAIVVVTMFPIMMIYPFFQKYFVKGVMIGAVKG